MDLLVFYLFLNLHGERSMIRRPSQKKEGAFITIHPSLMKGKKFSILIIYRIHTHFLDMTAFRRPSFSLPVWGVYGTTLLKKHCTNFVRKRIFHSVSESLRESLRVYNIDTTLLYLNKYLKNNTCVVVSQCTVESLGRNFKY